jgi:hypothetical protein
MEVKPTVPSRARGDSHADTGPAIAVLDQPIIPITVRCRTRRTRGMVAPVWRASCSRASRPAALSRAFHR